MHMDVASAIKKFVKCLELDPNHYGASIFLANLLVKTGNETRSFHYFSNAIRIKPE
jgi:Tfp pilus assembly protein PilF